MIDFKLPDVGEGMHEGEILKWFVKEGDVVKQDEPVLEVQTDKVNAELTSPVSGQIKKILYLEGEVAEVGSTLFKIEDGSTSSEAASRSSDENETISRQETGDRGQSSINRGSSGKIKGLATPYVRQLAREMNIRIDDLQGTGPAGRILESDLQSYSKESPSDHHTEKKEKEESHEPKPKNRSTPETSENSELNREKRIPFNGIRKKIADHMKKSVQIIPHVTHVEEIEMDEMIMIKDELKYYYQNQNIKVTLLPFFIKAVVTALKDFETFNASIDDETNEIILKEYYHIGLATDTKEGLIVPVIKDADKKSLVDIAKEITNLSHKAKNGELKLEEIKGSTFTISNVGPLGSLQATPIINHPEVGILAMHKMKQQNVVRNNESVIRQMLNVSLSFDHRLNDGATAVRFTNKMKELIENPKLLFMEMK
ncbi:2-oxoglutarate dehydrogenase [Salipaludibacillus keqinensis]|uniref:Dihydrolipoamide acetyltransferase component of pyruvate dehydrogenase complex n=1 Tax=Salipaludibacillus keqinensis TaxID=2045207 RepID=A0A323TI93_9BACI|nr:dihydrolipoamide acetyltransferase family protein [Salipaludibacillus keqinensis]PYZ94842.1 2-oxoglutarate dehydrogenase [Salipaludibacillus keqinensis]